LIKKFFLFFLIFQSLSISISYSQSFRLQRPVANNIQTNGSYLYGEPRYGNSSLAHLGIDISIKYDTVRSASEGLVTFVGYNPADTIGGYEPGGAGNYIVVRTYWEGKLLYLYYMHLQRPLRSVNDIVFPGMPLAISGNTGNSTGPHLHFELRLNTSSPSGSRNRRNAELWCAISGMGAIYGKVPGAANNTRVDISPDPKPRPPYTTFSYALTYNFNDPGIGSDDIYQENYAIGDVKPGAYTITALGGAYRRTVTVREGELVNADAPTAVAEEIQIKGFHLYQNYPNPFNGETWIEYSVSSSEYVTLKVYDVLGKEVATLVNEVKEAGIHNSQFSILNSPLPSGVYFYQLRAGDLIETKKMILQK